MTELLVLKVVTTFRGGGVRGGGDDNQTTRVSFIWRGHFLEDNKPVNCAEIRRVAHECGGLLCSSWDCAGGSFSPF